MFEGKYGKQFGTMLFATFVGDPDAANEQFGEGTFPGWAKHNNDHRNMIGFACAGRFELSPARR